jgi:hypothetical protein
MILLLAAIFAATEAAPLKPELPPLPPVYFELTLLSGARRTVIVQSLDSATLSTLDLDGRRHTDPVAGLLMLTRASRQPPSSTRLIAGGSDTPVAPRMVLFTTDGQILPGSPLSERGGSDTVLWSSPLIGRASVPLDLLSRVTTLQAARTTSPKVTQDTLNLRNGDTLSGFVESVGTSIDIETKSGTTKQHLSIPLERVDSLLLSQPLKPPTESLLATRSGMVISTTAVSINKRSIAFHPTLCGSATFSLADDQLESLVFNAASARPLSMCVFSPPTSQPDRAWTLPLEIRGMARGPFSGEIEFPGPMSVDAAIPAGAVAFMCSLELPHACRAWGDPTFVVSQSDAAGWHELKRVRLSGDAPTADLVVPLNGSTSLRLSVESGASGPIQDRVLLHSGILTLPTKPSAAPASK